MRKFGGEGKTCLKGDKSAGGIEIESVMKRMLEDRR